MCGLIGWVAIDEPIDVSSLYKANNSLKKRGPDDEGYFFIDIDNTNFHGSGKDTNHYHSKLPNFSTSSKKAKIAIAHRRLSIIDLSHNAHQPMMRENYVLAFNGEIYNFSELIAELEQGWEFKSKSDTEVIIASYKKWGKKMFEKFDGMWAIALLDIDNNELILSRDKFGEKPLYIYNNDNKIIFASEIKAVLESGLVKFEPDIESVQNFLFLSNNKFNKNKRGTLFKNINEVKPSTIVTISLINYKLKTEKYYDISKLKYKVNDISPLNVKNIFSKNLKKSFFADVPIALLLSGGVDSSINCILAAEIIGKNNITAYTSKVDDKDPDFQNSKKLCNLLGIKQKILDQTKADKNKIVENVLQYYDEPPQNIAGGAIGGMLLYQEIAKDGFKVVIEGNGADEVFAGYMHYYINSLFYFYISKGKICKAFTETISWLRNERAPIKWFIIILLRDISKKLLNLHKSIAIKSLFSKNTKILKKISNKNVDLYKIFNRRNNFITNHNLFDIKKFFIFQEYFPYYLYYSDYNSAFNSIESRQPFLLNEIFELGFTLPVSSQIKNGYGKYILRKAFYSENLKEILFRKKKQGFVFKSSDWIWDNKNLIISSVERSDFIQQFISIDEFKKIFKNFDYLKNNQVIMDIIWRLYSITIWHNIQLEYNK